MKIFFAFLVIFLLPFVFIQCEQEPPVSVEAQSTDFSFPGQKLSKVEIGDLEDYFKNFKYPENPLDYKRQFISGIHRSKWDAETLAKEEAKESERKEFYRTHTKEGLEALRIAQFSDALGKPRSVTGIQAVSNATYFWNVTSYSSSDYEDFDMANSVWGNMVWYYSPSPYAWDANTYYFDDYGADYVECRAFLVTYATNSTISSLYDSGMDEDNTGHTAPGYGNNLLVYGLSKPNTNKDKLMDVPGAFYYPDLNPSFETWNSGVPYAWNISPDGGWNLPDFFDPPTSNYYTTQNELANSSYKTLGTYSMQLKFARNSNRVTSSGYFLLPDSCIEGDYTATIQCAGTLTGVTLMLHLALFDENDDFIISYGAQLESNGATSFKLNTVDISILYDDPKYVRFCVQQIGQTPNSAYLDDLRFYYGGSDISLPADFGGFTTPAPHYDSYRKIHCYWVSYSELYCYRYGLFYYEDDEEITLASIYYENGQGNSSSTTYYNKQFYMNSGAWYEFQQRDGLEIFIGAQDYGGNWEYYENEGTWVPEP